MQSVEESVTSDLVFGTCGWEHDSWTPEFYPPELPLEWRLAFYAHYFPAVMVRSHAWIGCSRACLRQWLEDTGDDFRFVLELPPPGVCPPKEILSRVEALAPCVAGLVIPGGAYDLTEVLPRFARWPLVLRMVGSRFSPRDRQLLTDAGASILWDAAGPPPQGGGRLLVGLLSMPADREIGSAVRALMSAGQAFHSAALFIDGSVSAAIKAMAAADLLR